MKTKLLVICMTTTLFMGCGKSPSEMIQIGENHLNNKEYDSALTSFKVVFEKHIEDSLAPKAGYQIARIYLDNLDEVLLTSIFGEPSVDDILDGGEENTDPPDNERTTLTLSVGIKAFF